MAITTAVQLPGAEMESYEHKEVQVRQIKSRAFTTAHIHQHTCMNTVLLHRLEQLLHPTAELHTLISLTQRVWAVMEPLENYAS